ncbi:hypothetical protein CWC17_08655 [Pseudoalteromonas sp. S3785]|uniref:hypothetical protein n=1 Tax=Pseudoalteromonas sp. S3785 TaxID=579545 RepID=UPI00110A782E|nr:hypothetical protein [Pseudoalteromonas sp. S3785]TMO74255.1 hypothetical protein CWC17_08655 [Pseudoalteromonas sp. S3785]
MDLKFKQEIIDSLPDKHAELLKNFEVAIKAIYEQSKQRHIWNSNPNSEIELLNNQLDLLWSCYVNKFDELYTGLVNSINEEHYLIYGMLGRSIIEHAATMRYYFKNALKPSIDKAVESGQIENLRGINGLFDRFLRSGRFDWKAFFAGDFESLMTKNKSTNDLSQVNTLTCIQKWSKDKGSVEILYDLFCDLVHPNIGSSMLVMQTWDDGIGFGGNGKKFGHDILLKTIAGIILLFNEIKDYLKAMLLLQIHDTD